MGKTCCFTGHRPDKLDITTEELEKRLRKAIDEAIADGVTVFITGMAPGTDLIAGKIVLEHGDSGIRLICAVPFPNQSRPFSYEWKEIYNHILENADIVHLVCKEYSRQSFLRRDEWMVDRADCVFTVNGNSMEPKFHNGDMVMVSRIPDAPDLQPGEIGAFIVGNESYIKEYQEDGLNSLNPKYSTMHFSEEESVYLIGRVLGTAAPEEVADGQDVEAFLTVHGAES